MSVISEKSFAEPEFRVRSNPGPQTAGRAISGTRGVSPICLGADSKRLISPRSATCNARAVDDAQKL